MSWIMFIRTYTYVHVITSTLAVRCLRQRHKIERTGNDYGEIIGDKQESLIIFFPSILLSINARPPQNWPAVVVAARCRCCQSDRGNFAHLQHSYTGNYRAHFVYDIRQSPVGHIFTAFTGARARALFSLPILTYFVCSRYHVISFLAGGNGCGVNVAVVYACRCEHKGTLDGFSNCCLNGHLRTR